MVSFKYPVDISTQDTPQDPPQDDIYSNILMFCQTPHSKKEIATHFNYSDIKHFRDKYLKPLLESGKLVSTEPNKPTSKNQKYVTNIGYKN